MSALDDCIKITDSTMPITATQAEMELRQLRAVAGAARMIPWASVVDRVENPGSYIGDHITAKRIAKLAAALAALEG